MLGMYLILHLDKGTNLINILQFQKSFWNIDNVEHYGDTTLPFQRPTGIFTHLGYKQLTSFL